jgi:hypothetical protein
MNAMLANLKLPDEEKVEVTYTTRLWPPSSHLRPQGGQCSSLRAPRAFPPFCHDACQCARRRVLRAGHGGQGAYVLTDALVCALAGQGKCTQRSSRCALSEAALCCQVPPPCLCLCIQSV